MAKIRATIEIEATDIGKANVILTGALRDWQSKNREVIRYKIINIKELEFQRKQ
jgi:hypothetical protein